MGEELACQRKSASFVGPRLSTSTSNHPSLLLGVNKSLDVLDSSKGEGWILRPDEGSDKGFPEVGQAP